MLGCSLKKEKKAIFDTMYFVAFASATLILVTVVLNAVTLNVY